MLAVLIFNTSIVAAMSTTAATSATATLTSPTAKLKLAVAKFTPKAPKYKEIDAEGAAFSDMLITALFNTQRFIILEREIFAQMEEELRKGTQAPAYLVADVMVCGAVTGFDPDYKKTTIDIATILSTLGCLFTLFTGKKVKALEDIEKGEMEVEFKKSYVALDLRIVDVATRQILGATRVETITEDVKWSADLSVFHKSLALAGKFEVYRNTPMEKAIYESIKKAVDYIITIFNKVNKVE